MALDQLIQVLRLEAEAEIAAIEQAARTETETIRTRTDTDLAAHRDKVLAERDAQRRVIVEQALAVARRDARRSVLQARERLLGRVFAAARGRFPQVLVVTDFRATLPPQLAEALECLADRQGTLRCHPELRQELERLVGTRPGVRIVPDPAIGSGFKLVSDDGKMEIDATLEDRLARLEKHVRQDVLAELGSDP
jgi:vacuolar-type H+-ATPase subunit E/Vma4